MSERRLTVCQLLLSLCMGGTETLAARFARRLSERHRILFVCLEELGELGAALRDDGFTVHVLDKRPGIDWQAARRLRRLLRREEVDVVHAHQYGPFFYGALARLPTGPPLILTEHGRFHPDPVHRSHQLANPWLIGRHDRILAVGETVRRALIDVEGFPAERVEVVYNGIDTAKFTPSNHDRDAIRRELGVGLDDFVVAQVARLDSIKDHATAVRAIARLASTRPQTRLLLIGDGPEAGAIDDLIRSRRLERHVLRLGLRTDVGRLLGAADAVLLTSLSEGIPLTLIEGMAAGLPVVATQVGGVPEVVRNEVTGLLAPSGDDEALAGHLLRLADDRGLRNRLGRAGRERATSEFSETRMVAAYDQIYRDVAGRRRPRASALLQEA